MWPLNQIQEYPNNMRNKKKHIRTYQPMTVIYLLFRGDNSHNHISKTTKSFLKKFVPKCNYENKLSPFIFSSWLKWSKYFNKSSFSSQQKIAGFYYSYCGKLYNQNIYFYVLLPNFTALKIHNQKDEYTTVQK